MSVNTEIVDRYDDPGVLDPLWLWYVVFGDGGKGREHLYKTHRWGWGGRSNKRGSCKGGEGGCRCSKPRRG